MTTTAPQQSLTRPARRRVLDIARALFYAEGIRAVGVDRIIAEAGVAKATFYNHFPTKDELVCAYLAEESRRQREAAGMLHTLEAPGAEKILRLFDTLGELACGPGFRGCSFVNAAAEYPDAAHPVRAVIAEHRRWFRGLLEELLTGMGHPDTAATAAMLMLVRDGVVVGGDLDDAAAVRGVLRAAVTRLLAVPA